MSVICKFAKQVKKHYIDNKGVGSFEEVLKKSGATPEEVKNVSRAVNQRLKSISNKDIDTLMQKLIKDPEIKTKAPKFRKVVEGIVEGRLNASQVDTVVSEAYKLPTITKAKAEKISKLASEVQKLKANPGFNKNKLIETAAMLEREIAESTPSTFLKKADTYTTANLLLNPKTIERNLISNEFELLGNQFVSAALGKWKAADAQLLNSIRKGSWSQVSNDIAKGIRTTNLKGNEFYGAGSARVFRPEEKEGLAKAFEKLGAFQEKGLRYALEAHDVMVRNMSFAQNVMSALREVPALKNVQFKNQQDFNKFLTDLDDGKVKGIDKDKWEEIKRFSEWESTKTVLQDDSAFAKLANQFASIGKGTDIEPLMKFIVGTGLKFVKTPSNIVMRTLERDLLTGSAVNVGRYLLGKQKGLSEDFLKRQLLRGFTGTLSSAFGIGGAGYIMSAMGMLEPEGYKDSQVVKIGDTTFNIAPLAIFLPSLSLGAEVQQKLEAEKNVKSIVDAYGKNAQNIQAAILDSPLLAGAKKIFESVENFGTEKGNQKFAELIVQGGTQWVPFISMMRGIAKTIDDKERDTYSKNAFKKAINYAISNIPGLRQAMLPEKLDTAGRPVKPISDNIAVRFVDSMINPAVARKSPTADPVFKELRRLSKEEVRKKGTFRYAPSSIKPRGKDKISLTDKQKRQYQIAFGKYAYNKVKNLTNSPLYVQKTDEQKEEMIHQIELDGRKYAKQKMLLEVARK